MAPTDRAPLLLWGGRPAGWSALCRSEMASSGEALSFGGHDPPRLFGEGCLREPPAAHAMTAPLALSCAAYQNQAFPPAARDRRDENRVTSGTSHGTRSSPDRYIGPTIGIGSRCRRFPKKSGDFDRGERVAAAPPRERGGPPRKLRTVTRSAPAPFQRCCGAERLSSTNTSRIVQMSSPDKKPLLPRSRPRSQFVNPSSGRAQAHCPSTHLVNPVPT